MPRGAARFFVWIDNHYIGKDMNTLNSNQSKGSRHPVEASCWSPASVQGSAEPILTDHLANIKAYKEAARSNSMSIGNKLRELLVPILNRWGIGWDRGIWTFPMVIEDASNVRKAVPLSGDALYLVHGYLSKMLYESDGCGKCLYEYVEPIPLLHDVTYVWVISYYKEDPDDSDSGTLTVEGTIPQSLTDIVPPLPITGNHYHGPITQEYYDDVMSNASTGNDLIEFVQNLPTYKAGPNGTWVLDRDWDSNYYYPGLLGY